MLKVRLEYDLQFVCHMLFIKNLEYIFFFLRMDVCVESALLSSLTAWSSANRMAAMGETLIMMGSVPETCFSFGTELENRLLVEMLNTRHTEHVQAH